jgi:hypothetical protein
MVVIALLALSAPADAQSRRRGDDRRERNSDDGSGQRRSDSGDNDSGNGNDSGNDRSRSLSRSRRSGNGNGNGADFTDEYAIIVDRNIFLRERRSPQRQISRPSAPAIPEQSFVLTGIVYEDAEYHAYVEDLNRGTTIKLRVGDAVARGQVIGIEIDAIAYMFADGQTWVNIGCNLTGAPVGSVSAARISTVASAGAGLEPATTPSIEGAGGVSGAGGAGGVSGAGVTSGVDASGLSAEERMKLRRMQELGPPPPPPAPPPPPPPDQTQAVGQQQQQQQQADQPQEPEQ